MIIDLETLRSFPREHLDVVLEDPWVPLKREKKKDLQETGVVCIGLNSALTEAGECYCCSFAIPKYALSQFFHDWLDYGEEERLYQSNLETCR